MLHKVCQFRLLDASHLTKLTEGSSQGILRRLHALYHHGYLERPREQIRYFRKGMNRPLVYAITAKGIRALKHEGRVPQDSRTPKSYRSSLGLEHRLGISDFLIRLGSEKPESLDLRIENEIFSEKESTENNSDLRWACTIRDQGKEMQTSVIPDGVFWVRSAECPEWILYFLEYDRGTMPVKRRTLQQSSIQKKFLTYHASWKARTPQRKFGCSRIRVLFVTSNPNRMEAMKTQAEALNRGRGTGLFVFTSTEVLKSAPSIWKADLWCTHTEEPRNLLDF